MLPNKRQRIFSVASNHIYISFNLSLSTSIYATIHIASCGSPNGLIINAITSTIKNSFKSLYKSAANEDSAVINDSIDNIDIPRTSINFKNEINIDSSKITGNNIILSIHRITYTPLSLSSSCPPFIIVGR